MFWTNIYALSPQIEALLKKDDVTLLELMDQEEIVPECKSQNKTLVDYLSRPEIMQELVTLTIKEPSMDIDERSRYKYANIACELLTCNVPSLNEKLAGDEALLAKLYSFIETDEPLNPLLASFFSKTIGVLLTRRSDQNWYSYQFICFHVLEFLKTRKTCVDRLLQHLETSAIMDLVLKLVTKVEGNEMRQNVLNWLDSEKLVQRLIQSLAPTSDPERHANASQLLCDMIKSARYFRITCTERVEPDPILNTLEHEKTIQLVLDTVITEEPMESSIVGGIQVLLALLSPATNNIGNEQDVQSNGTSEDESDSGRLHMIQNATFEYFELLRDLLINPPLKPPIKTTAGLLNSPLGNTRLHVAKLFVALVQNENIEVFTKLAYLHTFQILLDLFFQYSWNNFLHTQVEHCLAAVLTTDWHKNTETVYHHIFVDCKLTERLLDAWNQNQNPQNKVQEKTNIRQGYMGHLIQIVKNIVKQCAKCPDLDAYLKTHRSPESAKQWEEFVTTEFVKTNKTQELELGGKPQPFMSGSDDPNEAYNAYGQDAYVQQIYADYQSQLMTPTFIDQCGYHDDEFNDRDDALHHYMLSNSIDQLTTMSFALNEEDLDKSEDMFNKICQQKQNAGLNESGGGTEWGDEGELTFQTVIDKRDWPSKQQHHDSNSSDEEEDPREMNMEPEPDVDPWAGSNLLPRVSPWDPTPVAPSDYGKWANFDNFETVLSMTEALKINDTLPTSPGVDAEPANLINAPLPDLPIGSSMPVSISSVEVFENPSQVDKIMEDSTFVSTAEITIHEQSQRAQIFEVPGKSSIPEDVSLATSEPTREEEKSVVRSVDEPAESKAEDSQKSEHTVNVEVSEKLEKSQIPEKTPNPVETFPTKSESTDEGLEKNVAQSAKVPVVSKVEDLQKSENTLSTEGAEKGDKSQTML